MPQNTVTADREFGQRLQQLDALIGQVDRFTDPAARAQTREIVGGLLELHGAALARLIDHVRAAGAAGQAILDGCAADAVVSGLLLLHELHPLSLEERVRQAVEQVRPALRTHGGSVELVAVRDGVVHLRLLGNCHGCPSSAVTLQQTVEEAIYARAPDVAGIEVEGITESLPEMPAAARVALPVL